MDKEFQIVQEMPDHHFRTEIPNIIFDIGLSPYAISVYAHLKRIAGDSSACWRTIKTLSEQCGIKETKLKEILLELSNINPVMGVALIKKVPRIKENGSKDSNLIFIINIWKLNGDKFRSSSKKGGGSPNDLGVGRNTNQGGSPNDYKEEPSQEEPSQEDPISSSSSSRASSSQPVPISDDACGADDDFEKEDTSSIWFTKTSGERSEVSQSEIYRHFLKKPYSTQVLKKAIRKIREIESPINNIFKYLESVCETIHKKSKNTEKKVIENKQQRPKIIEETETFEETCKRLNIPNPFLLGTS